MKLNKLIAEYNEHLETLIKYREMFGRNGYREENLPSLTQLRAMVLMKDQGRELIEVEQSDLIAFQSKGLLTEFQSLDEFPTSMLRFLALISPWLNLSNDLFGLVQAAIDNNSTEPFPPGILSSPDNILLKSPGLTVTVTLTVKELDHIALLLPYSEKNSLVCKACDFDGSVISAVISSPLFVSNKQSSLIIIGVSDTKTYRREIQTRTMTPQEFLDSIQPMRWSI